MNKYFRKFKKNAKALSPVVASIILIAVTVAVSVVVAAWMGGMTIGLMGNAEQASIANIAFIGTNQIDVLVQNSGSTTVNITQAYINGVGTTVTTTAGPLSVDKSGATTFHVTSPTALSAGNSYQIKLITAKGTQIQNSAVYNP
jgi:archaeal type IV pilus assembly protein PilA